MKAGWSIAPLMISAAVYSVGSGLFSTLLPLRLELMGFNGTEIGLVMTANMVGFILGCLATPAMLRSVGHVQTYSACTAVVVALTLAFEWVDSIALAAALRAFTGFAVAALSVVMESWLNALSTNENRGRVLTSYVLTLGLFYGLGQLAARDIDAMGHALLMIPAALIALSMIPLTAVRVQSPPLPKKVGIHLLTAFRISPTGALGAFATGLIATTFASVGVLLAPHYNLDQATIVYLLAASQIGGIVFQYPLGWFSDRLDRRYILLAMHIVVLIVSAAFILATPETPFWIFLVLFVGFAGFAEALYPISVAQANDRAKPQDYVAVSSNLLLLWAVGGGIGPLIGTPLLEQAGAPAFFWYVSGITLVLGLLTLWRILSKRRIDAETTLEEFQVYPTTSPAIYEFIPHKPLSPFPKGPEGKPSDGKPGESPP